MTRREQLEEKLKAIKNQMKALDARDNAKARKERNHRLIRLGAMLEADESQKTLLGKYIAALAKEDEKKKVKKPEEKKEGKKELF